MLRQGPLHLRLHIALGGKPLPEVREAYVDRLFKIFDTDEDGLWDYLDNCLTVHDPTGHDGDDDGVGDVCDDCPDVPNPEQGAVEFPVVVASDGQTLSWPEPVDFDYVKGPLGQVGVLSVTEAGSIAAGDSLSIGGDIGSTYYLLRYSGPCGTWGSTVRDSTIP